MENAVSNNAIESESASSRGWTLRQRLIVIITIALLPIVVVSVLQGLERVQRDERDVREQLVQSARSNAEVYQGIFTSAGQILRAMGSLSDVRDMNGNCDTILADAMIGVSYFSNLSRVDSKGTVVCSALPLAKGVTLRNLQVFQAARTASGLVVSPMLVSRATGERVIAAQLALRKADGGFDGTVGITLDVHWFDDLLRGRPLPKEAVVTVFDRNGRVLASNNPRVGDTIAAAAEAAHFPSGVALEAADHRGANWRLGVVALTGGNLFVAFGEKESRLFSSTYLHVGIDFVLPIFMILFAWFAIHIATDRQVTQWISYLRRIATAYRSGHYAIRPDLLGAPAEFQLLGDAMSEMAEGIQDRDHRLREAVNLKTTLIREIHHRVKNNLQIVMSLLSIQANQVKDMGARDALMQAQTRINALALVHRILNELEDQSTLDLRQLLEELSHQIAEGMGDTDHVHIEVDVPSMVVSGGTAVALALFTVEALTNIFKHAFPREARGVIRVTLEPDGPGSLRLAITDDGVGFQTEEASKSVGSRLIRTFGAQLGGISQVQSEAGRGTVVSLVFPDPALKAARNAGTRAHAAE